MNIIRILPAIAVVLLTGCKIVIQVPEGGSVVSESGAYECQSGQECEIGVYDVFFDETFFAQAAPGYEFLVWRKAPSRFCGGETEPCHLSTAGFPGHDNLLAFLESDTSFYLEPVFRQTVNGEYKLEYRDSDMPRVIDKNGRVIGSFVKINEYGTSWDIQVNFKGVPETYTLSIVVTRSAPMPSDFYYTDMAYPGDTCDTEVTPLALPWDGNFEKDRVYMRSPLKLYIPDPDGHFTNSSYEKRWESATINCIRNSNSSQEGRAFPLAPTNLELQFPLVVEGTDIVIFQDHQLVIN